jgi:predicted ATPase
MNQSQTIVKRFTISDPEKDLLGRGGMGDVYRAIDTQSGEEVAVKALNLSALARDPGLLERFVREGEALRQLNHPNIVRMVAAVEENGQHYLVMEFVRGGSLQDLLAAQKSLPISQVIKIALEVADALTRAHHLGIIHRDIKPANVLIAEDGTPRLTDFGIASMSGASRLTETGLLVGTIDYLSPEACQGLPPDERSDIWAFGVMLFELLTGRVPFKGGNITAILTAILTQPTPDLTQLNRDIPDPLADLVYRMLEKDRLQRIPSVRLVGAELEALLKGREPITPSRAIQGESRFATPTPPVGTPRHNLPTQTTPFVGREAELHEMSRLLADPSVRLLTVLGVGGMGKTRLALEAGREQIDHFERGVYFVPLAGLESFEAIVPAIAKSLDFSFYEGGEPRQQLLDYLRGKHMLLILDNFEHLLDGVNLVSEILHTAAKVKMMVTSRVKLNVQEEHIFHLEGMDFPDWETPADALEYSAVKLFLQSARRAKPGFELRAEDLKYVARICRLVGGMPLGILLAAAWIEMLMLDEVAKEIEQSVDFLETSLSDIPERQHSMRAVFDYAWKLLTEHEQKVLHGLSVFRGGLTREAAQQVTGATLRDLMGLVDKSLIHRHLITGRYDIHELLRQYALEKLVESGEEKTLRNRHRDWFLELAERAAPELHRATQLEWLDRLEVELENLRAGLDWALEQEEAEIALRFAGALAEFWDMRGYYSEAQGWYERSLTLADSNEHLHKSVWRARVLLYLGDLIVGTGDLSQLDRSHQIISEALEILKELNDKSNIARALLVISVICYSRGDLDKAISTAEEAVTIARMSDDKYMVALSLYYLAFYLPSKEYFRYQALYEESLRILQIVGDRGLLASCLCNLGYLEALLGNVENGRYLLKQALSNSTEIKDWQSISSVYFYLGSLAFEQGEYKMAEAYYQQSLTMARDMNRKGLVAQVVNRLGRVALYQLKMHEASSLYKECLETSTALQDDELTAKIQIDIGFMYLWENRNIEAGIFFKDYLPSLIDKPLSVRWAVLALYGLGELSRRQGKLKESLEHYHQAIKLIPEWEPAFTLDYSLEGLVKTISDMGESERAVHLLGAAASMRKKWGGVIHPVFRAEYDKYINLLREKLGEATFATIWEEGQSMTIEQAIELALREEQQ